MSTEEDFGSRFLAELGRLGVGPGNFNYKTVMAIKGADRARFAEQFKKMAPQAPYELIQAALSDEPEVLARKVVAAHSVDILPLIIVSF
jgi:hypothetical protein